MASSNNLGGKESRKYTFMERFFSASR